MRIASRELRSSRGKFFFVILSVAIGVAALTGVRGFSASFRATLLTRARAIMAADLSARMFQQPTAEEQKGLDEVAATGVEMTPVTELLSMASSPKTMDPLLVTLKAVDPTKYPFYGTVELQNGGRLRTVLGPGTVVVADDLLVRLHMQIGDELKLGDKLFRIASVVSNEPDRLSGSFAAGPRVLISREGLESSGLLAPGSHAGQRYLFKVPAPSNGTGISDSAVAELKARLERLLPEAQVMDYRETNPALTQGLDRATSLLSLMSLVALVLGAVGVAMAMRAHLQQRMDSIAIMKSLGAGSAQIIKIYLIQTLLLGVMGGVLGVGLGVRVQLAFPWLLAKLVNIDTTLHLQWRTVVTGLAAGILTTLLFTLPPLLDIRSVRPVLIFRRAVEDADDPFVSAIFAQAAKECCAAECGGADPAGADGDCDDAVGLGDGGASSFRWGWCRCCWCWCWRRRVCCGCCGWFLKRGGFSLPSSLRHGLANLYRPGNPSAALLAALGLGVMQIMTVYLVQQAVVSELHISSAPNLPNVFLIDITSEEIGGVRALLKAQPTVTATPEFLPVVSSRILEIDGVEANKAKMKNFPKRMLQAISLTYADAPPPGTTAVAGRWWTAAQAADAGKHPLVAVNQPQAERLGLHVGSTITFAAQDARFTARVAAMTQVDGQHAFSRAEFVLPESGAGGAAGDLVRRGACDPEAGGRAAAGVVCGVSDGDGDQRGAGA